MKLFAALFAVVTLAVAPNIYADNLSLTLASGNTVNVTGTATATGDVFTYDHLAVPVFQGDTFLGIYNINFTGAYVDVGTFPPGVASEFVVTESCVGLVIGVGIGVPCPGLSFAYTNTDVGNVVDVMGGVNIGASVNADVVGADVGLGIGAGTETFEFGPPPSATPEPGTLSMLGTGLLGMAGIVRKRFCA